MMRSLTMIAAIGAVLSTDDIGAAGGPSDTAVPTPKTLEELEAEEAATAAELKRHEDADAAQIAAARKPSLGRIVIVREGKGVAPGIITGLHEDGGIEVELFRASHINHAVHHAIEVDADPSSGDGWYWPPRV